MQVKDFIRIRSSVSPFFEEKPDEDEIKKLQDSQFALIPVVNDSGVLVTVQKRIGKSLKDIPYETYDSEFMLQHGAVNLPSQPISGFQLFDQLSKAISQSFIVKSSNE